MNTLLNEMDAFLKENYKPKKEVYKPRKQTFDKIERKLSTHAIHYISRAMSNMFSYYGKIRNEDLLLEITEFNHKKLRIMADTHKEKLFQTLKKGFEVDTIPKNNYNHFFSQKRIPIAERVRFVTNGIDMTGYVLISKEEEKRVLSHFKNLTMNILEYTLYDDGKKLPDIYKNMADILDEKNTKYSWIGYAASDFFKESKINSLVYDQNIQEEIKDVIRNRAKLFKEDLLGKPKSFSNLSSYMYLLTNEEVEEQKEKAEKVISESFEELKGTVNKENVLKIKHLRDQLNRMYKEIKLRNEKI